MNQSELEKVSEALRDELEAGVFSQDFTPGETFDPRMKLEDADTLKVDVVPVGVRPERENRGEIAWDSTCDIGVRYRFGTDEQDEDTGKTRNRHIHELFYLEQEIIQYLVRSSRLQYYDLARLMEFDIRVTWVPKHLEEWRQFTGILRVTYRSETTYLNKDGEKV